METSSRTVSEMFPPTSGFDTLRTDLLRMSANQRYLCESKIDTASFPLLTEALLSYIFVFSSIGVIGSLLTISILSHKVVVMLSQLLLNGDRMICLN